MFLPHGELDRNRRASKSIAAAGASLTDLVFLEMGLFHLGIPRFKGWKSLDFLGFSRPKRAFS
ncbi:MAG TPA: hypothetical protein VLI91_00130, partial [Roseiarcus sp.]|nr:hypothetical protein [Roseiarcus sp.]